jgi:hypothetical protein
MEDKLNFKVYGRPQVNLTSPELGTAQPQLVYLIFAFTKKNTQIGKLVLNYDHNGKCASWKAFIFVNFH